MSNQSITRQPLYVDKIRCNTCGNIIGPVVLEYKKKIMELTNNDFTAIPIRTISTQKLKENSKTEEGKILDSFGLYRYCCRKNILTQPNNYIPIKFL